MQSIKFPMTTLYWYLNRTSAMKLQLKDKLGS